MWGWLIALAVIAGLAVLPLGVSAKYNCDGPLVKVIVGPIRFVVFPKKKKEKKAEEPQKQKIEDSSQKKKTSKNTAEKPEEKGGSVLDFLPLVRVALDFLDDFRWKLRVKRLELKLILAGDDPCDLAENYGRAWAAVGNLLPALERSFVIKKRDVEVECDFTADETLVIARLDLTITFGRTLVLLVRHGVRALRTYLKINKTRKGGALK